MSYSLFGSLYQDRPRRLRGLNHRRCGLILNQQLWRCVCRFARGQRRVYGCRLQQSDRPVLVRFIN